MEVIDDILVSTSPTESNSLKPKLSSSVSSVDIFLTNNMQSDGKNNLKRISFEYKNREYNLILNPEEYTQAEPNRVTITQTKSSAWSDEFGSGIQTITMKGTTGFKNGNSDPTIGFKKFKELRDLMRHVRDDIRPGEEITSEDELIFHNYTDGEHWIVIPNTFSLLRSISRPLLYLYDIQLYCIRRADIPSVQERIDSSKLLPFLRLLEVLF